MSLGVLPTRVPGLPTHWALTKVTTTAQQEPWSTRFWFYPVSSLHVEVRTDVVTIQGVEITLRTETPQSDGKQPSTTNAAAELWAHAVNAHLGALAREHASLARLYGLYELVALTKALEEMEDRPPLDFWLQSYPLHPVETRKEVQAVTREAPHGLNVKISARGGIQLVALAMRLQDGDITALKEAVVHTRPSPEALTWSFAVSGDWIIPTAAAFKPVQGVPARLKDAPVLWAQALFFHKKERYQEAIVCFEKLLELYPNVADPYIGRGLGRLMLKQYDDAITDFSQALQLDPTRVEIYYRRGLSYSAKGLSEQALSDFDQVLKYVPQHAQAYFAKAREYEQRGQIREALDAYTSFLHHASPEDAPERAIAQRQRKLLER
jgi:tetratricopeptide (TPR) repeat protein